MGDLAAKLTEELTCETVFTIPILGGIPISESVVVTWIIMAALLVISILLTRNLKVHHISRRQAAVEAGVTALENIISGILGEEGKAYGTYLFTVLVYLAIANLIGLLGFKPPTKDLNVTAALALMSIVLIEYAGIHKKGVKKWLKGFSEPIAIVTPINILEIFIRPLSLCMRLFGNVLGGFVVMELIKTIIPVVIPVPFSFYFDIFDGLIQAYVFVFLTGLFINEAIE
ncbi:MAG: F0F1 ATP synthase subunit A [bacterium]|nr:F0F1 ATP synthase subunit A [bacterium]